MAWRPYERLIGGELEFKNGMAKGYAYFLTLGLVRFCLKQNYITSGKVKFEKSFEQEQEDMKSLIEKEPVLEKRSGYMKGFSRVQKGELGDFATGKDDNKYADYFYFEWYSENNGRVVYEGTSEEVQILEPLIFNFPSDHRENQQDHMNNFLTNMCVSVTKETGKPMVGIQVPTPNEN
jgi:hypothetical protein